MRASMRANPNITLSHWNQMVPSLLRSDARLSRALLSLQACGRTAIAPPALTTGSSGRSYDFRKRA